MTNAQQTPLFPYLDPEDQRLELKTCHNGILPDDIWKPISAFSNTEGGQLILGVTPDQHPVGLDSVQIDKVQRDILSIYQTSFNYPVTPDIQVIGTVVVVHIQPADAPVRPIYSTSRGLPRGAYIRVGASNIQITAEILSQFATAARGGAEPIEFREISYGECFDFAIVDDYIDMINQSRNSIFRGTSQEEVLTKMRAVTKSGYPTLFGVLAFGRDTVLQQLTAPTTNIAITQYATDSKVDPNNLEETFIDDKEFNGNIIAQFEAASQYIRTKLPVRGVVDENGRRREFLSIPEIAIREALANALTHRDYGTYSSRTQVDIYSDRIEIINPGTSLVPIENIDSTPSVSRNPSLMSFLKDYHITEQRARGIRTIRDSLRKAGLQEPLFENLASSFRITLYNSAFISSDDHAWLQQFRKHKLNERQLTTLTHLKNTGGDITNSSYRELNHMNNVGDDRKARHELDRLTTLGLIAPVGENRHRKYLLKHANEDI